MPITFECSECGQGYTIPDSKAGARFKCKSCGASQQIPKSKSAKDATTKREASQPTRDAKATKADAPPKRHPRPSILLSNNSLPPRKRQPRKRPLKLSNRQPRRRSRPASAL